MTNPEHVQITKLLQKLIWAIDDLKTSVDKISLELNLGRKNF
jgi:hypothetical protein